MRRYGIFYYYEPYSGVSFTWDTYEASREQVIKTLELQLNEISKFISPKEVYDFIKALSNKDSGDELYDNLCENLTYVYDLIKNAPKESQKDLNKIIFGESIPYNTNDECHLFLFERTAFYGHNFSLLLEPHKYLLKHSTITYSRPSGQYVPNPNRTYKIIAIPATNEYNKIYGQRTKKRLRARPKKRDLGR